ncbi:flagellar basal body rod protein FlgF [Burkholderia ubonensis]|uniref:flagellar basal body rod protein FlgF n=1 Tax=Burkholderia ubonensis TaxID=101571 RepID=UPI0007526B19|nr:flagellar basal body rod protein FlgF [Burkholderia ubonensis]KWB79422.1 flagellar biosynthesis protein FlgF [Burkholderia ubonensis]
MDRLIYTIMSAADRLQYSLQLHANNMANAQTDGFRADLELAESRDVRGVGYDSRHQVDLTANRIDQTTGQSIETGRALDAAIDGPGYFAVQTSKGEAYTRDGNFQIDGDGRLTVAGNPVVGEMGPIVLPQYDSVKIGADGTISILPSGQTEMQVVDKLKLVREPAPASITKNDAGLIVSQNGSPLPDDPSVVVRGEHIETSNVSPVNELMKTMTLNRDFEIQMRLYKAADDNAEQGNQLIRG